MPMRILTLLFLFLLAATARASGGEGGGSSPYFEFTPPFVVNVSDGGEVHHMQVNIQVRLAGPDAAGLLEEHMPAIRHALVLLLSDQDAKQMRTVPGKEKLRKAALEAVQKVLEENTGQKGIEALYFTGLIIQ